MHTARTPDRLVVAYLQVLNRVSLIPSQASESDWLSNA